MAGKLKILILEDNQADAALLVTELKRSGLEFEHQVCNTREGYEKLIDQCMPDIILSDYTLPSFDGLTAFKIKMEKCPEIPFIIISGTIGEENAIELIKSGVTDYALKDKLFVIGSKITRAIKEARETELKKREAEKLRLQHKKLLEIAFLQSHQVRRPVASILGLISLFQHKAEKYEENLEVVKRLNIAATELDNIIKEIVKKTEDIVSTQK